MTDETNGTTPSEQGDPELGHRLSAVRLQAGLTQAGVAEKVGVSRQHISNIETGLTSPTVRVLADFLHACGTGLAEFFYGPLPTDQTPGQREHHRKLQTLLDNTTIAPIIAKVLDSFIMSTQFSRTALIQSIQQQPRRNGARRAQHQNTPSS
jgi:transcriptional regulator with XRE-family HTH domain